MNLGGSGLKNRGYLNTTVDLVIRERLRELSKDTKITISRLVDEALQDLLAKYEKEKSRR